MHGHLDPGGGSHRGSLVVVLLSSSGVTLVSVMVTETSEQSGTGSQAGSSSAGSEAMVTEPSPRRMNNVSPHVVAATCSPSPSNMLSRPPGPLATSLTIDASASAGR